MLNDIRKAADNLLMRILLTLIAVAFIGWGVKDVLQTSNNFDLITFTHAKNISNDNFLKAKAEQIHTIQQQTGMHLTEEDIKQLDIDNFVIKKLIGNRIMNYLVAYYDLDLTKDAVIQFIKESPNFKNDKGKFDVVLFKNFLKNSYISEKQYILDAKEHSLKNILISIFIESFQPPKIMVKNIIDYLAETRKVDLVQIDLTSIPKGTFMVHADPAELEELYKKNHEIFEIPEKRNLSYIKISKQILSKQAEANKEESEENLLKFYQENQEEFGGKKFSDVRKQINELLRQQRIEEAKLSLIKNLEDDVAAGSSLAEIAEKYNLPIDNLISVSQNDLINKADFVRDANVVFDLAEGELSYPIELPDQGAFILVEVKSICLSKLPEFAEVKDQVYQLWYKQYIRKINLENIENFAKKYKPSKSGASLNIAINQEAIFSRSEIHTNKELPTALLLAIFQTNIGFNTPVFQSKDMAYFAYIKSQEIDPAKKAEIQKKKSQDIVNNIKNNVIDELMSYALQKNKMTQMQQPRQ